MRTLVRAMLAAAGALGLIQPALADIALESTVHKVERVALDDGRVETRLVAAERVVPGDELRYTIAFRNAGDTPIDPGTIVITDKLPGDLEYIDGTAYGAGTQVTYSVDGGVTFGSPEALSVVREGVEAPAQPRDYTHIRWQFTPPLTPGEGAHVSFNARLQ
jgi:uncharacterized repeat protein (TIGR01451 family)